MSDEFTTRDEAGPALMDVNFHCGQLAVVRHRLRTNVNDLRKSVDERKKLYDDLKMREAEIISLIDQASLGLSPSELQWVKEQKAQL